MHAAPVASDVAFAGSFALRTGCALSGGMFVFVFRSEMSYGNRAGIFLPATTGVRFGVHVRLYKFHASMLWKSAMYSSSRISDNSARPVGVPDSAGRPAAARP